MTAGVSLTQTLTHWPPPAPTPLSIPPPPPTPSTNKLMKRLEQLKREKQILATEVEQEEEMITNTLQKKLEKVRAAAAVVKERQT
jgi:hypothetical protein